MSIERKRLCILQTTFKFLEKIESVLPYNLAYECSRIKEELTCVGASPDYMNITKYPDIHKSTLERRKREPLMANMCPFKTTKSKESNGNEPTSRTKNSPEQDHIIRTSSPINMHQQPQAIPTRLKNSFSPVSNPPYSNIFRVNSEPRPFTKTSGPTDYPLRTCNSPLPSIPNTEKVHFINVPSICRSPLPETPTYAVKESPPAPKDHELVGNDVSFVLGTSPLTPKCYAQCKRVAHKYHNIIEDKSTEYQNTPRVKPTCLGVKGYIPERRQIIHN